MSNKAPDWLKEDMASAVESLKSTESSPKTPRLAQANIGTQDQRGGRQSRPKKISGANSKKNKAERTLTKTFGIPYDEDIQNRTLAIKEAIETKNFFEISQRQILKRVVDLGLAELEKEFFSDKKT